MRLRQAVHRTQLMLGGQARAAAQVQRTLCGVPAGLHEEVGKSRVRFVGALRRECRLCSQAERQRQRHVAGVAELNLAHFAVVFRADPDRRAGQQVGPLAVKDHAVGLHAAAVSGLWVGRRMGR